MITGLPSSRNTAFNVIFWLACLLHLLIPLYNHYVFRTDGFDYAVYNFAFYDYAHFRVSPCPIYQAGYPISFWQDHFSLLLPLLSPLYWVMAPVTGTYSLMIVQWVFVMAGGVSTFRIISRRSGIEWFGLMAALCYFLFHGRFTAHRADVNLAIMASSLVPVLLDLFDRRKWWWVLAMSALIAVIREDMALWLLFIGVFLAIYYRSDKVARRNALWLAGGSISYFMVCMSVLIPVFLENELKKFTLFEYAALGKNAGEVVKYLVHDPLQVFKMLFINHSDSDYFDNIKNDFYMLYLLSGGALLILRPWFLIPLLPLLSKKMLNDNPVRWGIESYYAIEFVSILPVLIFLAISALRNPLHRNILVIVALLAVVTCTTWALLRPRTTVLLFDDRKYNILNKGFYLPGHAGEARKILHMIPDEAPVCASGQLTSHLAFRDVIHMMPVLTDSSYVVARLEGDSYPISQEDFNKVLGDLYDNREEWKVLYRSPNYVLLKGEPAK